MLELILLILGVLIILFVLSNLPYWLRWRSDKHGSARVLKHSKIISRKHNGIVVDGTNSLSVTKSFQHFLCACASGAGKTTINIISTIINWKGSILCSDIKNELFIMLSPYLKKKGYDLMQLNLADVPQSLRFNPLAHLSNQTEIRNFCKMIMNMNSNGKEDQFWVSGSIMLLETIIRCLVNIKDEKYMNLANVIHILNYARADNKLEDLKYLVLLYGKGSYDDDTIALYERLRHNETKILAGWIAGAIAAMSAFDSPELKLLTAKNEVKFEDLRRKKTAFFIITTVGKSLEYRSFLSLFYYQLLTYLRDSEVHKDDQDLICCLDEFGNLSKLEGFPAITSLVRSKRVSLNIILQDLEQLTTTYSQSEASVILSNMSSHLLLPGMMSLKTLSYYEALLGLETKEEVDLDTGKYSYTRRNLYNKDEIRRLSKENNEALLLHSDLNPIRLKTKPIYDNRRLMRKAGLRNKNGTLVSVLPPVPVREGQFAPLTYLDLDFLKNHVQSLIQTGKISEKTGVIIPPEKYMHQ